MVVLGVSPPYPATLRGQAGPVHALYSALPAVACGVPLLYLTRLRIAGIIRHRY